MLHIAAEENFQTEISPNLYPAQNIPENHRGRKTPKLFLQGYSHPDTKTRKRSHKKRKLQANVTDEHRCKTPQQIFFQAGSLFDFVP